MKNQVLATFTSNSNPSKKYNIIKGDDGVTYCDCPGWKFKKTCRHLTEYARQQNLSEFYEKYYPEDIIQKAVNLIKGAH